MSKGGYADGIVTDILRLGRAVESTLRDGAMDLGLTLTQAEALRFAANFRPDVATVGNLARLLGVRHSTAIGIVAPLVDRELLVKEPHAYDGREKTLRLTQKGREALDRLEQVQGTIERVLGVLSRPELESVEQALATLSRGMQRSGALCMAAACAGCAHFRRGAGRSADHHCTLHRRDYTESETLMLCPDHVPAFAAG